jgi:MFS transporter, ACS family, glucarate transporter
MLQAATPIDRDIKTTHVRFSVLAFLCVLSFLTYYDRQCLVRAQPDMVRSLGLSDGQMGIVLGAFWFAYALFEIPSGWMGDRIGARLTLSRIVLAWSLFTALTGVATGFYSLLVYRLLFGAGEAGAYPNMARIQSRWLPKIERARAGGLLWLCARWGAAFAPFLFGSITRGVEFLHASFAGSPIASWLAGIPSWRIGFIISGLLGIGWCLMFYPWFRDEPAQKRSVSPDELHHIHAHRGEIETTHHMDATTWRKLFTSPSLWAIGIYYFCGSFAWSFFMSWMPRYMNDVHQVSFQKSEWSAALPLLCGGIACLVGGVLSDELVRRTGWRRLGRAVFPMTGCFIAAAAMLGIRHADSQREATILMCVAAAAFDFGQAANWAAIVDIGGRYAGVALGFINMIGCLAHAVQPFIGQDVFNRVGWNALFGIYAVAYLLAMITWTVINPLKRFYEVRK